MRETALMDFLHGDGIAAAVEPWAPSPEKIIETTQLPAGADPGGDPGAAGPQEGTPGPARGTNQAQQFLSAAAHRFDPPAVTADTSARPRPPGFGPPRHPGTGPTAPARSVPLDPADPDALEDLTYAELARARGLDAEAVERISHMTLQKAGRLTTEQPAAPAAPDSDPAGEPDSDPAGEPPFPARSQQPGPVPVAPTPASQPGPEPVAPGDIMQGISPAVLAGLAPKRTVPPLPRTGNSGVPGTEPALPALAHRGGRYQSIAPSAGRARKDLPSAGAARTAYSGGVPRPDSRPAPGPDPEDALLPGAAVPTWPPPGWKGPSPAAPKDDRHLGPLPSKHRPDPNQKSRWRRFFAGAVVLGLAGPAAWYLVARDRHEAPSRWDPRVVALASFVEHQRGLSWKHPVAVTFLSGSGYAERFGQSLAAAGSRHGPAGANQATYLAGERTVYVNGTVLDVYKDLALAGQLTEALQAQYPGTTSVTAADAAAVKVQAAFVHSLSPGQLLALNGEERTGP